MGIPVHGVCYKSCRTPDSKHVRWETAEYSCGVGGHADNPIFFQRTGKPTGGTITAEVVGSGGPTRVGG